MDIPFGKVKDEKLYLNPWGSHPERTIGEVRDGNVEKSTAFFLERFKDLENKVEEVIQKIDSTENKGSFLMKVVHLLELLPSHEGLGDYEKLQLKLQNYESLIQDIIKKNRARNTEIKKSLVEEAQQIKEIINWNEATVLANDLKERWIKTGNPKEEDQESLEKGFWSLIKEFFDRKKQFYEDKSKLTLHRKSQYEKLIDEAKNLKATDKNRFELVKELKEKWKLIGGIPADLYQPLNTLFHESLKTKQPRKEKVDYEEIKKRLNQIATDYSLFNKQEVDQIKRSLFQNKQFSREKKEIADKIQLLLERDFILKIASRRFKDFKKFEKEKKLQIKLGIIRDLISRDEDDLKVYEENSANFSSSDGKTSKLVANKIRSQRNKIATKKELLRKVQEENF